MPDSNNSSDKRSVERLRSYIAGIEKLTEFVKSIRKYMREEDAETRRRAHEGADRWREGLRRLEDQNPPRGSGRDPP